MAARRKVTDEAILECYGRLGTGAAVARETGVHEQTIYQVLRRLECRCIRCGGPIPSGKQKSCPKCLEFDQTRMKKIRAIRRRDGVCIQCEGVRSPLSNLYCDKHRRDAADRNVRYHSKLKVLKGSPQGEAMNFRQKMESLLSRFGQAGRDRWTHADGACEVCGTKYGDAAIHVHHIDEDKTNNTYENFICLCQNCHVATHALLRAKTPASLLDWFRRTYPEALERC